MELSKRQEKILEIVKDFGPVTGMQIADRLNLSRATLRPDLAMLIRAGVLGARPRVGYYITGKAPEDVVAGILGSIRVSEAHSVPVVVRKDCSVYDAIVTMFTEDVGTITVVSEGGFLEGVASRKDMLKAALGNKELGSLPVSIVMTRMPNVIVTYMEEEVVKAAQKLINHQVDALPVVNIINVNGEEKYQVVGRFTKTNIARLFVQLSENRD